MTGSSSRVFFRHTSKVRINIKGRTEHYVDLTVEVCKFRKFSFRRTCRLFRELYAQSAKNPMMQKLKFCL